VWPLLVVLAFAGGVAWHLASAQEPARKPVQRWEYRKGDHRADIKALGEEGWELVTAVQEAPHSTILYFKRPK